jgi:hypothetical protein
VERFFGYVKLTVFLAVAATVLTFCCDWIVLCYRIGTKSGGFGAVTVHRTITSSLKSGKYDIYPLPPEDQVCVNSLFPHQGYPACWYLRRHDHVTTQL